jgi:hypothetical protein
MKMPTQGSKLMPKQAAWIAVALIGMSYPGSACAQAAAIKHTLSAGPAYTSKNGLNGPSFPRIDVLVRLRDGNGTLQPSQANDLRLFSGGTEVGRASSTRTFADAGYGVRAILALDFSAGMNGAPLAAIRSSIATFLSHARPQDRLQVMTLANDSRIEVPFGAEKTLIAERVQEVKGRGTETHLYDGLLDALAQLQGEPACRQLTVISDGNDQGSQHNVDEVIRKALAGRVTIDSIGLTHSHPELLESLARISQATGGSYARARSTHEVEALIDQGILAMRAVPVAAFNVSKFSADGKAHDLELRWQPENLTALVLVNTPSIGSRWKIWGWVLAGCLVVGATLLIVFLWRVQRKPLAAFQQPIPVQAPLAVKPAPPPPVRRSGFSVMAGKKASNTAGPSRALAPTIAKGPTLSYIRPAARSSRISASSKTRERIRNRKPSGPSSENMPPRPGTTSRIKLRVFPIFKLAAAHVERLAVHLAQLHIRVACNELAARIAHRGTAVAAAPRLVEHQRPMLLAQNPYQVDCQIGRNTCSGNSP